MIIRSWSGRGGGAVDADAAGVCAKEEVIANIEEGRFSAAFGTGTGLENFNEAEVGLKLR